MAFEDDYELINGIPVLKKYIKQPEIAPLPEEQPDWQAQHELPAAPAPVTPSPTIAPVDSRPVAAPAPVAPQMAPIPEAVAQPLTPDNPPTVQDLQQMPQAAPAPVVKPEEVKAEVRAKEAPTEVGPEAAPEVEQDPLVASAVRTGEAIANAEAQALAANEAYTKEAERLTAERDAQRVKQQERIAAATDEIESASKRYQEQLAKTPPDRKTQNLLTILFSTLATAMSRGKIPNNALQLIQAGNEQQERENLRSNAAAKAEVDRARQLYGDLTAEFDAEEHVFNTRMASQEKNLASRLRTYAQGAKSVQAKEQALTMADNLEAQAAARTADATAKAAEAKRKAEQDAAEQRRKDEELKLKREGLQLDKQQFYQKAANDKQQNALGWARMSLDERRMLKEDEKDKRQAEYQRAETARLHESVKQMVEGKTVKLGPGLKYSAPTEKIANEMAKVEAFSVHALSGIDQLLNIRAEAGKEYWDSPAGQQMTTLHMDLLQQLKGPEYADLGALAGADLDNMLDLIGKNPADAWISTRPKLELMRQRIADKRSTAHKVIGQYDGDVPEIAKRLPPGAANLSPEQAESQFRTAVTAAGTVASAEDRKAGADSYYTQMKAAGRLPDAYRKIALVKDEEEAAIKRLQDQVKALPSGDPQAAALQDQIAQRKEVVQDLGLKERDAETRFREQGGVKKLNANREAVLKEVQGRQKARSLASDIFTEYMVAESEPVYAEIQKLREEGRDLDAADALLKAQRGKPGADVLLGKIQKIRKLYRD